MSREKSIEDMYQELIEQVGLGENESGSYTDYDDGEDFVTSKEIVKQKEDLEERFGIDTNKRRSNGDGIIEEEVHFKRYTKKREHKYTEKELEEIRKSCECTIVHDYGVNDKYHQTDEERAANDMLQELGIKLQGLKRTYRKVDQYIEAMRIVMQAWEMLETKGNYMHSKEEFFKLVAEGRIVSNQIIMPRLKKIDSYNIDLIIKYISNPDLDPSDLVPEPVHDDWDDWYLDDEEAESVEEKMMRLLSPEDFEFIALHQDNPPEIQVSDMKRKYIKGYNKRSYNFSKRRKKGGKKQNKNEKFIQEGLHEILNKIQVSQRVSSGYTASSLVTDDLFDSGKRRKSFWDDLYFDGSWANENDLFLYDLAVREEMLKQHTPGSSYLTYGDKELAKFFKILEDNGVNTIDLRRKMDCKTDGSLSKAEEVAKKKDNKKIEEALIQRITKLNNNDKFKKIVAKAEDALAKHAEEY